MNKNLPESRISKDFLNLTILTKVNDRQKTKQSQEQVLPELAREEH